MAFGVCELLWLRNLLIELGVDSQEAMKLYCDNTSAIEIAHNPVQHDWTKHVEIDRHFIKEKLEAGIIVFPFVKSEDQLADVLTKAVANNVFEDSLTCTYVGQVLWLTTNWESKRMSSFLMPMSLARLSPTMSASYSASLLVALKPQRMACWMRSPSRERSVRLRRSLSSCGVTFGAKSAIKSANTCDLRAVRGWKVMSFMLYFWSTSKAWHKWSRCCSSRRDLTSMSSM
ncbi:hypothetical protein UlMin_015666 [Ulmus minor]